MKRTGWVLALAILAGCAGSSYTPTVQYLIAPDTRVEPVGNRTGKSLGVRTLEAARPADRAMVYTDDGFTLRSYPYAAWAEGPRDAVTRVLADALTETGAVDVGKAADMRAPDYILTGQLRLFQEDRSSGAAMAVCEIRLDLRARSGEEAVWSETVRVAAPLADSTPVDLARAMSEAVSGVAERAAAAIAAALEP